MMKSKSNFWEWLGAGILAFGLIIRIINDLIEHENGFIPYLHSHNQLFYWGGITIFALGYLFNPKRKKTNKAK